ncbi:MAG: bifunctional phosphoribosylaminoimidazolecarboxamide formyltransferase/IMP cyclohydrolase [Actinobacteria bacterium]|nr:bifunctional phosphoribosylaminoimidazolecarboxamide formyltransferase/IMP cyclohydrolase [Actinomycetota bacterium]
MIERALLSVYDKRGLDDFARGLSELGIELVASGGTASFLEEAGIEVARVEELTEVPELLGGRVKTLHPRVHAAILARSDHDEDMATLAAHGIEPFGLVCASFYPFPGELSPLAEEEVIELIDIGGPSMLRAAAKNYAHVVPVGDPAQYGDVLAELRAEGAVSRRTRHRLAAAAFAMTAAYEASIAGWFSRGHVFPSRLTTRYDKVLDLAYGENPHQQAALYADHDARAHLFSGVEQLHGRPLSYVNLLDLAAGRGLLEDLEGPACVIVKHANPCGAAFAQSIEDAFEGALACDPVSAFGMVCVLNGPVGERLGGRLAERFIDVLYAPSYADEALAPLRAKPGTRILAGPDSLPERAREVRGVPGGVLVQDPDSLPDDPGDMQVVCGSPSEAQRRDLLFAWRVCRHVTSNAIVVAREGRTIGIGSGQVSRVDAVRIALDKAAAHGHDVGGAVLASDAYFPFPDGPQAALDAGVKAIIQPGGSKRDADVVDAVQGAGAAMVLTGRRHFRH